MRRLTRLTVLVLLALGLATSFGSAVAASPAPSTPELVSSGPNDCPWSLSACF